MAVAELWAVKNKSKRPRDAERAAGVTDQKVRKDRITKILSRCSYDE